MRNPQIKVSMVEDNLPLATELKKCLSDAENIECIGVYASAEEALQSVPGNPPDVILVDLKLPGMSGVELIRNLKARCPGVQCLVLTMYAESELIFDALKAGACGYLLKRIKPEEITDAIRQVHAGGSVMTPRIARRVLEIFAGAPETKAAPAEDYSLTEREIAVLQKMVDGQARKQIVHGLDINTHTLDYIIRCIYRKLHVKCLAAAVSVAVRDRIVSQIK
jgi:DNA-binding NarL/FixJ family response regulator